MIHLRYPYFIQVCGIWKLELINEERVMGNEQKKQKGQDKPSPKPNLSHSIQIQN